MIGDLDLLLPGPVERGDSWRWATVTQVSPLRVRLDGDAAPLNTTPDTLASVVVGERVWVQLVGRRLVVHGPAAALPAPQSAAGSGGTVTATSWADLPGTTALAITCQAPTLVAISFGAWVNKGSSTFVCMGVKVTGATSQGEAVPNWGAVAYSALTGDAEQSVTKHVVCAVGTSTFTLRAYQNGDPSASIRYPYLDVAPIRSV